MPLRTAMTIATPAVLTPRTNMLQLAASNAATRR